MRPARKGPENPRFQHRLQHEVCASMRPARKGPENFRVPLILLGDLELQ